METIGTRTRTGEEAPEALSRDGATALAKRLENFWLEQGHLAARF